MAGDWIKMRMDLPEDPAVYRLARITGLDRLSVVGRLYAFWSWADKHAVDGRVDGASTLDLDDVVKFSGFAEAMAEVHWLEIGADYLSIPKHDRHNGESAKERSLKNARQARWRDKSGGSVDDEPSTAASTPASTSPSTREEKRREEELFVRFYDAYPRKVGKDAARKAFAKRKVDEALLASMIAAIKAQGLREKCAKGESQFVPHPSTWLNEGRWLDEAGLVDDDPYGLKKAINYER
jgi:hypothetical protein